MCPRCGQDESRCEWLVHGNEIRDRLLVIKEECPALKNHNLRFEGYKIATGLIHGILGKYNRVQLPDCVTNGIRNLYPGSNYVGFRNNRG